MFGASGYAAETEKTATAEPNEESLTVPSCRRDEPGAPPASLNRSTLTPPPVVGSPLSKTHTKFNWKLPGPVEKESAAGPKFAMESLKSIEDPRLL